jgi:hypothetical protein
MDILLSSEIELWNEGILLDGHSFVDVSFYNKDGRVLYGTDVRGRFKLPADIEAKSRVVLNIIEAEFKRWFCQQEGKRHVPHWMTGWLLVTFLGTKGIVDLAGFKDTCTLIEKTPLLASTSAFKKYKMKQELEADEFINLFRVVKADVSS